MTKLRSARITGINDCPRLTPLISVQFKGIPIDFGLDGRRLRGWGPSFYLDSMVQGYQREKPLGAYTEYGPRGLIEGTWIRCQVSDTLPEGLVISVAPFRRKKPGPNDAE